MSVGTGLTLRLLETKKIVFMSGLLRMATAVISIDKSEYLHDALVESLERNLMDLKISSDVELITSKPHCDKIFQYGDYEQLNFDQVMVDSNYLICSYVYRKSLIRKHYLAHTIHSYVVKHPDSILVSAFPETFQIEVDYAEFLDDALDECYELRDEIEKKEKTWILKPSMSDKGQGIRVFKTLDQLQEVFDSFEEDEDDEEEDGENEESTGIITSQLRHFVVQEYLPSPLLLPEYGNRKFHIRTYVLASGSLKVYVFKRMLTLFAGVKYNKEILVRLEEEFAALDMNEHLTNTCIQGPKAEENNSVVEFAQLKGLDSSMRQKITEQIFEIVGDLFKAAISVDRFNFQPLENAFEFYGLDFLVDENGNVSVLEVNAYPDFKQTGNNLKSLVYELVEETVKKVVVPFYKGTQPTESPMLINVLDEKLNG